MRTELVQHSVHREAHVDEMSPRVIQMAWFGYISHLSLAKVGNLLTMPATVLASVEGEGGTPYVYICTLYIVQCLGMSYKMVDVPSTKMTMGHTFPPEL